MISAKYSQFPCFIVQGRQHLSSKWDGCLGGKWNQISDSAIWSIWGVISFRIRPHTCQADNVPWKVDGKRLSSSRPAVFFFKVVLADPGGPGRPWCPGSESLAPGHQFQLRVLQSCAGEKTSNTYLRYYHCPPWRLRSRGCRDLSGQQVFWSWFSKTEPWRSQRAGPKNRSL